ncbi:MAG TPA: PDZ domain-containing protein, partial [Verrucomicrobiae bacterium]
FSGGALVDAEGRLIGINDAIVSPSGTSAGIGFAVPINMARNVMEEILNGGRVTRGFLGIMPQDIDADFAKEFNLPGQNGALVGDVFPGTPAAKAGIKSGDVLLAINGKDISDAHDLQLTISQCAPGSTVTLKAIRNGANKTFTVNLTELPESAMASSQYNADSESSIADALDGVKVADLNAQVRQQLRVPDGLNGTIVTDVDSSSNSAEAGLLANDIIVEINRQPVAGSDDAVRLCRAAKGGQILVKVWRRAGDLAGTRFISVDNTRRVK